MGLVRVGIVTLFLACSSFLYADVLSPRDWLDRASRAFKELNYDGVFIYRQGEKINTLRVIHANIDGVENEKLMHLDQEMREIVRRGHEITCVHPGDQMVRLDHSIPSGPFAKVFSGNNQRVEENYELALVSEKARVAGRAAVELELGAKDDFRYGYKVWFDRNTGLLLKSHLMGENGKVLEGFQFTKLDVGQKIDPALLKPSEEGHIVAHHHAVSDAQKLKETVSSKWRADWLPAGFVMAAKDVRRGGPVELPLNTLMYTDGLSVFSIFIEGVKDSSAYQATSYHGATVAVSRDVVANDGRYLVTVVGEVPVRTATKVADSVGPIQ